MRGRPLWVLIADDHPPTRDDVRRAIEGDERLDACASAADAAEAVQAALRQRPDICLLDIRMPGSGLAAAWVIKARLPQARVAIMSLVGRWGATGFGARLFAPAPGAGLVATE